MERPRSPEARQPGELGAWAPYYDVLMKFLTLGRERTLRAMTVDLAGVKAGDAVLEVGCGTGSLTLTIPRRVGGIGEVHGVDLAPEMIDVARRKNARAGNPVDFQVASIDRLPFPEATFDVAICSFMIFHMPDDVRQRGLVDIFRVLRPGGRLLIVDGVKIDVESLRRMMTTAGFVGIDSGRRSFGRLAPSVRYLRAGADKS